PDHLGYLTDQLAGMESLFDEIVRHRGDELHFAVVRPADHHNGTGCFLAQPIHLLAHLFFRSGGHFTNDDLGTAGFGCGRQQLVSGVLQIGSGSLLELLLELFDFLLQALDSGRQLFLLAVKAAGQVSEDSVVLLYGGDCLSSCDAGQTTYPLADGLFADDFEEASLAGVLQVRTTTKLAAEAVANLDNADHVAVFVAKE